MQITHLTSDQAREVITESTTLAQLDWDGSRTHVMTSSTGRDFIMVENLTTGGAIMVDGCEHDRDSGGSAHDHARG